MLKVLGRGFGRNPFSKGFFPFKEGWNTEEVSHTLCAFANDINNWGGGYIVIDIREDHGRPVLPPVGINHAYIDKIQKKLLNLCNRLKPSYFPVAEPVIFQGEAHLHHLGTWRTKSSLPGSGFTGQTCAIQLLHSQIRQHGGSQD